MSRKSSLKKLPPDILEAVNQLIAGGQTIEAITSHLKTLLGDDAPSKSAVQRYKADIEVVRASIDQIRDMALAIKSKLGDKGKLATHDLMIDLLSVKIIEELTSGKGFDNVTGINLNAFSGAIKKILDAKHSDLKYIEAIKIAERQEVADAAVKVAIDEGLSKQSAAKIYQVLGIEAPKKTKVRRCEE